MSRQFSFIFIVFIVLSLHGCMTQSTVESFEELWGIRNSDCVVSHLSMCFNNDSSSFFGRVRTDGFYYYPKKHETIIADTIYKFDSEDPWGREIYRIVFFPNKMYGGNFFFIDDARVGVGEWGVYDVFNDTIITECMTRGSGNMASYGFRDTLIVKSPDTLILQSRTSICPEESNYDNYFHYYKGERGDEFYFMPCDRLPNTDKSWIKKKKWFWCDENEWKQYKETQKK